MTASDRTGIALLAKAPVPGHVKTRFCPPCTPDEAAALARAFLQDTAAVLSTKSISREADGWSSYQGASDELEEIFGDRIIEQRGDDFGTRIANATEDLFDLGYRAVIALCADCPTVDQEYLLTALDLLRKHDVVFGPARDGGCVLVGLARRAQEIFKEVEMSTDHVHDDMVTVADRLGLTHFTMSLRHDLDTIDDLEKAIADGELRHAAHTLHLATAGAKARRARSVDRSELTTPLTPFTDAIDQVLSHIRVLEARETFITAASGLVSGESVTSPIDIPPSDSSLMDGYAIKASSTTGASTANPVHLTDPSKIMTGHLLPAGADSVLPWEYTYPDEKGIWVTHPVTRNEFVRPLGESLHAGQTVLNAKDVIRAHDVGTLASVGLTRVSAIPRPRVAILSTGDELITPDEQLGHGDVYDANGPMLHTLLTQMGAEVIQQDLCRDDRETIVEWFQEVASTVDLIVTSGGASVGEHDWMRSILSEHGELHVWRVALKPGKPFAYGSFSDTPVFVLPGNPASVLACTHAFVWPSLRLMSGRSPIHEDGRVVLVSKMVGSPNRTFLCPVHVSNGTAHPAPIATSSTIVNHKATNAYAVINPGGAFAGESVAVKWYVESNPIWHM